MTHPLILAYGKTYTKAFPLILIIGREPNNGTKSDNSLGNFDFQDFPRCSFWNMAFKLVGSFNGLNTLEVKGVFAKTNSAPIIFSDAAAQGIFNEVVDKNSVRATLVKDDFDSQVEAIFSHHDLMKRVKLILTSGLSHSIYSNFKAALHNEAKGMQIPSVDISFLYGTNYPKIQGEIGSNGATIIKQVFEEYRISADVTVD